MKLLVNDCLLKRITVFLFLVLLNIISANAQQNLSPAKDRFTAFCFFLPYNKCCAYYLRNYRY